jgi:hypothetical protein
MRVDTLHRRIVEDLRLMHTAVAPLLPEIMPGQYETHAMNLMSFLHRLNEVTSPLGVFNELEDDLEVAPELVKITGLWLPSVTLPQNDSPADIRIIWHVHPTTRRVPLTHNEWSRRRYFFWQMFMHELVHRHQDVYRPANSQVRVYRPTSEQRSVIKDQEYYGNFDEIEAHAYETALELVTWWAHLTYREAMAASLDYTGRLVVPTFRFYFCTFQDSPKHPALRHYKKKVKAWYHEIKRHLDVYTELNLPNLVA